MAVLLIVSGALLFIFRRRFLLLQRAEARAGNASADVRLEQALQRRVRLERTPSALLALAVAGCALVGAAVEAFTTVSTSIPFSIFALVYAAVATSTFASARHEVARRAAPLRPRSAASLPLAAYAPALAAALVPLLYLRADRNAALVAMTAALLVIGLACVVAVLPLRASGEDFASERFVDESLRLGRALELLALSSGIVYLFITTTEFVHPPISVWSFLVACTFIATQLLARRSLARLPHRR